MDEGKRDRAVERLMAQRLERGLRPAGASCLSAETLAAYFERTLAAAERLACEQHLASCRHCQALMAELARLAGGDAVTAHAPAAGRRPWTMRLAWAAPALVALLVVGVWSTREFKERFEKHNQVATVQKTPPAPPAKMESRGAFEYFEKTPGAGPTGQATKAVAPQPLRVTREANKSAALDAVSGVSPRREPAATPAPGAIAPPSERAILATAQTAAAEESVGARVEGAARPKASGERKDEIQAATVNAAPAAPAEQAERAKQEKPAPAEGGATQTVEVAKSAPAPAEPGTPAPTAEAKKKKGSTRLAGQQLGSAGKSSLGESNLENGTTLPVWRVTPKGKLEKESADGHWEPVATDSRAKLFDVAFASPSTGWAVGAKGTVLRTTDGGASWAAVTSPTSEDLLQVHTEGELGARVTARSGRIFATQDAGLTWQPARED